MNLKLGFRRTHIPSGKEEVRLFDPDFCKFMIKGKVVDKPQHWVECGNKIRSWNAMGIVNGERMWQYELVIVCVNEHGEIKELNYD